MCYSKNFKLCEDELKSGRYPPQFQFLLAEIIINNCLCIFLDISYAQKVCFHKDKIGQ